MPVHVFDAGGVNAATQMYSAIANHPGGQLNAKLYGTPSEVVLMHTGWVDGFDWFPPADEGRVKLTTGKYYSYAYHCFGWGLSHTNAYGTWQTHQTSRHTYP